MALQKIKKRNGEVVDFNPRKITAAVEKAFMAVQGAVESAKLNAITENVVAEAEKIFTEQIPRVEDLQDIVEKEIMAGGFYDVAKAYILYRYEHHKERTEKRKEVIAKIEKNELTVLTRSGRQEKFDAAKLRDVFRWAVSGYENIIDMEVLVEQCKAGLYDRIPTSEIARAAVMTARSFIELDPAYSHLASRLLLRKLYQEIIGIAPEAGLGWEDGYRAAFIKNLRRAVGLERLSPKMLIFDLEKLARELKPERDELLRYLGTETLAGRYFLQNPQTKEVLETPQAFWMRVAMGLALNEPEREKRAVEFYEVISTLRFTSSTPTLFHSGTAHPQLSSCYLTTIDDSLDHIFKCIADNAQLSKWSGGLGNDWTNLRGMGALIKGTGVESQGVIPFLKIANDTTVAINRSGRRRGATCAYLETWHIDIEDFLELRKNTGDERRRTHDMNTANWIPDLFIKRVREDGDWTLFSPDETPDLHHIYGRKFEERYKYYENLAAQGKLRLTKKLKARDLWRKMITMLFETGHPWVTFKDPCNIRSPQDHIGVVHSSNLCTEITLNTSAEETAVCNLGSVNLAKHIKDGEFDVELVKSTVTTAMRMLDNVIDLNFYPTVEAKNSNLKHRPVGLGIMGFQDALYMQDINFDSTECARFADYSMEVISYYAILASAELARERGPYQSFPGSKWDRGIFPIDTLDLLEKERGSKIEIERTNTLDWGVARQAVKAHGMRNSNCLAVAPTATISNIAGCFPTIEPIYKNIYTKANQSGDFVVVNTYLVDDLKKIGLWDYEMLGKLKYNDGSIKNIPEIPLRLKEKYKEVFEIDPRWLIKAAAYRGKWVDQSQSLNIFFRGSSGKQLAELYQYAWDLGLKTTYYLRTLAVSQVEKSTVNTTEFGVTHKREFAPVKIPVTAAAPKITEPVLVSSINIEKESAYMQTADDAKQPDTKSHPELVEGSHNSPAGDLSTEFTTSAVEGPRDDKQTTAEHKPTFISIKEVLQEANQIKLCKVNDPTCEACQ